MGKENEINVKLIQHTPLLHFQYDSEGATLRATEVKPKLDRFLISKLPGTTREGKFEQCEELLVGYSPNPQKQRVLRNRFCKEGFNALNYRMQISAQGRDTSVTLKNMNYPLVLSTMGREPKHVDLCIVKEGKERMRTVELSINISICVKKEGRVEILRDKEESLRKLIKDNIVEFFALNNFGQRSDKGFGSFTVLKIDGVSKIGEERQYIKNAPYIQFDLEGNMLAQSRFLKLFSVIDFYWKTLKSGINYTKKIFYENGYVERKYGENYIKSYLYIYLNQKKSKEKDYTWEKKEIKQKFGLTCKLPEKERKEWENEAKNRKPVFARALLGYPSSGFTYRWQEEEDLKDKIVSVSANKDIARIPSPIIFKPVLEKPEDGVRNVNIYINIYILFNESLISAIQSKGTVDFNFKSVGKSFCMPTPMNVIDYRELIDFYHEQVKPMKPIYNNGKPILDNVHLSEPKKKK